MRVTIWVRGWQALCRCSTFLLTALLSSYYDDNSWMAEHNGLVLLVVWLIAFCASVGWDDLTKWE